MTKELELQEKKLRKRILSLEEKLSKTQQDLNTVKSKQEIQCGSCGNIDQIGNLIYLQDHWYVSPYSCSGGDYWREGEGGFLCSKCGVKNRLIFESEFWIAYKPQFKAVEETWEGSSKDGKKYPWINHHFVTLRALRESTKKLKKSLPKN